VSAAVVIIGALLLSWMVRIKVPEKVEE